MIRDHRFCSPVPTRSPPLPVPIAAVINRVQHSGPARGVMFGRRCRSAATGVGRRSAADRTALAGVTGPSCLARIIERVSRAAAPARRFMHGRPAGGSGPFGRPYTDTGRVRFARVASVALLPL